MWRTGTTITLGWAAMFAGLGVGIWRFVESDWVFGVVALAAGAAALAAATALANALTRTINR